MATRLKDIAQDLDLSVVTVSKVLRNHPDIGEATRKRVLQRVKELNYQPNLPARSLVTGQTWTFGLVVPSLLHPFFAVIAKEITASIRKYGYSLLIASSDEDPEMEMLEIRQFLARRVDAIMVASCQRSATGMTRMGMQNTPCILIDRRLSGIEADFVGTDDVQVGELATTHLLEQGYRRIAHICGPDVSTSLGRMEGYKRALARRGLEPLPGHLVSVGASGDHRGQEGGYGAAMKLLEAPKRPDAIFCYNDPCAIGAMRAIFEMGLRVPRDVALVGCGDLPYSDSLRVPLSSIDQGGEAIGRYAAAVALKMAKKKQEQRKFKTELIPCRLVVRESSQPRARSHRDTQGASENRS